jgi:hypothetical protein
MQGRFSTAVCFLATTMAVGLILFVAKARQTESKPKTGLVGKSALSRGQNSQNTNGTRSWTPNVAQGGHGVVVPGGSICKVRLETVSQFTEHLYGRVRAAMTGSSRWMTPHTPPTSRWPCTNSYRCERPSLSA